MQLVDGCVLTTAPHLGDSLQHVAHYARGVRLAVVVADVLPQLTACIYYASNHTPLLDNSAFL